MGARFLSLCFPAGNVKGGVLLIACLFELAAVRVALPQSWSPRGPGPSLNGQTEGIRTEIGLNPVAGAINAIALGATTNVLYAGAVNGGVWMTTTATSTARQAPHWAPLTDSLPALSINSLAIGSDGKTLFAGTGSTSAFGMAGISAIGVAKSTDGGITWSVLASDKFKGKAINSIVSTGGGDVVLAATLAEPAGGVYRSTDGGENFTRISGGSGLPDAGVSSLVADPGDSNRFYAAVPNNPLTRNSGSPGVYVSTDGGVTWEQTQGEIPAGILEGSVRILLSVSGASGNPVYAMFIGGVPNKYGSSGACRVVRSADAGATWLDMGVPTPDIFPGGQGNIHGTIAASPNNPNIVWVGGDTQAGNLPEDAPNINGCRAYSASVLRGDFSVIERGSTASGLRVNPWSNAVCDGANGSSPHADTRAMVFDKNGNLLLANDGGISRLQDPDSSGRTWVDIGGDIQPTEMHSIAYDSLSHLPLAGAQDTGTPIQYGDGVWKDFTGGDGGIVAVDADQTSHPGSSYRYTSNYQLGNFSRTEFDNQGNMINMSKTTIALKIESGDGTGQDLRDFECPTEPCRTIPFYTRYTLNRINPKRMLIGTTNLYESDDRGATVTNLGSLTNLGQITGSICALAYGGRSGGVDNPDVFYAGTQSVPGYCAGQTGEEQFPTQAVATQGPAITGAILHRTSPGGAVTQLKYQGSGVVSLAVDPQNFKRVFVVDSDNTVWGSFDEGENWTNLTGNITAIIQSVEVFSTDATGGNTVLMVGTMNGVFQMRNPTPGAGSGVAWSQLGEGLPNAIVYDLHYDYTDNVLVAGTLGRGAWLLKNPF